MNYKIETIHALEDIILPDTLQGLEGRGVCPSRVLYLNPEGIHYPALHAIFSVDSSVNDSRMDIVSFYHQFSAFLTHYFNTGPGIAFFQADNTSPELHILCTTSFHFEEISELIPYVISQSIQKNISSPQMLWERDDDER